MGGSLGIVLMVGVCGFFLGGAISFGRQGKVVPAVILAIAAVAAIITAFLWAKA